MKLDGNSPAKILDVVGALVIVMDTQGRIKFFNPACEELTGYTFEEVKDVPIWELFIIEKEILGVKNIFNELKSSIFPNHYENYWKTKDGSLRLIDWHNTAITDENENVEYIVGTGMDVTEKRKVERRLKENEERFRAYIENAPVGIFVIDGHGQYIEVNPKACKMRGCTKEELLNSKISDFTHPDYLSEGAAHFREVQEKGYAERTILGRRKDGTNFWMQILGVRLGEGEFISFQSDLTHLKEVEENLKEANTLSNSIFESIQDGIVVLDHDFNIYYTNHIIKKWHSDELPFEGKKCYQVFGKSSSPCKSCPVSSCLNTGKLKKEVIIRKTQFGKKWLEVYTYPLYEAETGKTIGVVKSIRDITERKKYEEKIKYLSFHDKLTGIYNRTYLEEEMQRLDTERQLPISMIMVDLNGLKLVNDTYGHNTGDEMLKSAADILKKSCRKEDIIARWGGDEFVVLLVQTSLEKAGAVCKRIKKGSQGVHVKDVPISMAVGTATKNSIKKDLAKVLTEAEDDMYKQKLAESRSVRNTVLNTLLKTLGTKSFETEEHNQRMLMVARKIGEKLELADSELNRLNLLITLHDIGKINIPENVLTKPGLLTEEEWKLIKTHPETGYRIALATEEFAHVAEEILLHHERWDGAGYPRGLNRKEIPLLARIVTIADAFDVMTHERNYKKAMSKEEALEEIRNCAGTQFDPELVEVFLEIMGSN